MKKEEGNQNGECAKENSGSRSFREEQNKLGVESTIKGRRNVWKNERKKSRKKPGRCAAVAGKGVDAQIEKKSTSHPADRRPIEIRREKT